MSQGHPASGAVRVGVLAAKILLSLGLIWYAFSRIDVGAAAAHLRAVPWTAIAAALVLLLVQMLLASLRLRELLHAFGERVSMPKCLDVVMIGAFFSQTFLSFLGGDAMRIWRMAQAKIAVGVATRAVVFDRAAGFVGLIIVVACGVPLLFEFVTQPQMRSGLLAAIAMAVIGFVVFLSLWRMPAVLKRWKALQWIAELSATAVALSKSRRGIVALVVLSLAIHLLNVVILYVFGAGLDIALTFAQALVLFPPVIFLAMLPISVAGWGVREGAMVVALGLVAVPGPQSLALSICFGLSLLAVSLPGGVLWLATRAARPRTEIVS